MTKFEKLTQAIENMTGQTIKPEQIKRSKLCNGIRLPSARPRFFTARHSV